MNFYDRPDCWNPSPYIDEYGTKSGIFIFKKYLNEELVVKIEDQLKESPKLDYDDTLISWYSDKISITPDGLFDVWEEISKLLYPTWVIHPQNNLLVVNPGDGGMFIHSDSPGKHACHRLSQIDTWSTCCLLDYGVVAYFGDYEGGEIFYPNINPDGTIKEKGADHSEPCFEYKPERGDVIIHSAFDPYAHGVREVTSGTRFAFSTFSLKAKDNPGTFYNYGTKEYYEQIGDKSPERLKIWTMPLKENPQFTRDKIEIYKESGLEGEELSEKFFKDMEESTK